MPPGDAPRREGRVRERSPLGRDRSDREYSAARRGGRDWRDEAHGRMGSSRHGRDGHRERRSREHEGEDDRWRGWRRGRDESDRGERTAMPARAAAGAQEIYSRLPVHPLFAPRAEAQSVSDGHSAEDAGRPNPYLADGSETQRRRQALALAEEGSSGRQVGAHSETRTSELSKPKAPLPNNTDVAWWDRGLLEAVARGAHVFDAAVQRPRLSARAGESLVAPPQRVHLTRDETRRLRRQRRLRAQREAQELARLGLGPPGESSRVRLATLGRVPGAVLAPSALELAAREDAARRRDAHLRANAERSLAAREARREANSGSAGGLPAVRAVFCVQGSAVLGVPARFRVTRGAVQNGLAGVAVFSAAPGLPVAAVVAVHGPPAGVGRYRRLLERRVPWPPGVCVRVVHAGPCGAAGAGGCGPRRLHTVDAGSAAEARRALRVHGLADVWDAVGEQ